MKGLDFAAAGAEQPDLDEEEEEEEESDEDEDEEDDDEEDDEEEDDEDEEEDEEAEDNDDEDEEEDEDDEENEEEEEVVPEKKAAPAKPTPAALLQPADPDPKSGNVSRVLVTRTDPSARPRDPQLGQPGSRARAPLQASRQGPASHSQQPPPALRASAGEPPRSPAWRLGRGRQVRVGDPVGRYAPG